MISKELLSILTGKNVIEVYVRKDQTRMKTNDINGDWNSSSDVPIPNIHELAYECKKWAKSKGMDIYSSVHTTYIDGRPFVGGQDIKFYAEEADGVFKACQWILENQSKV